MRVTKTTKILAASALVAGLGVGLSACGSSFLGLTVAVFLVLVLVV